MPGSTLHAFGRPLTQANLRCFNGPAVEMSSTTSVPKTTSSALLNKESHDRVSEIRKVLMINNLLIHEDTQDLDRYPDLKSVVDDIITDERSSSMKHDVLKSLEETRRTYKNHNENTFLIYFMLHLLGGARMIIDRPDGGLPSQAETQWITLDWSTEQLLTGFRVALKRGMVPKLKTQDSIVTALLKKLPRA